MAGRHALLLALVLAGAGCSGETWKRTTYETLQNVNQQQCEKAPGAGCDRQSYDAYRRMQEDGADPAR